MDVDSRMTTEYNFDSDAPTANALVRGSGSETSSSSAPSTPGTPTAAAAWTGPGPRRGTLTAVPAVGEDGSPGYVGPRLILFGGPMALEGSSATLSSSAGSVGSVLPAPQQMSTAMMYYQISGAGWNWPCGFICGGSSCSRSYTTKTAMAQSGGSRTWSRSTIWACDGLGWTEVLVDYRWK